LILAGANPNVRSKSGFDIKKLLASRSESPQKAAVVKLLLQHGLEVDESTPDLYELKKAMPDESPKSKLKALQRIEELYAGKWEEACLALYVSTDNLFVFLDVN